MSTTACNYFIANDRNTGDTLAALGAKYILHEAIGFHHFHELFHEYDGKHIPLIDADVAVVIGTPWLWDHCWQSEKYQHLDSFHRHSASKRIALGVGADDEALRWWRQYRGIICRDHLALRFFSKIAPTRNLPCPSLFAAQAAGIHPSPSRGEVLIYCALDTASSGRYLTDDQMGQIQEMQFKLIAQGTAVVTMTQEDRKRFEKTFNRLVPCLSDPITLLKYLSEFKTVISARVHGCMAGLSFGLEAKIIPIDTRAYTAMQVGAVPIVTWPDMETPPIIKCTLAEYVDTVKGMVE